MTVEEWLVVTTGQANHLAMGRSVGNTHCRCGESRLVFLTNGDEKRTVHTARTPARLIDAGPKGRPARHLLRPVGVKVTSQRPAAVQSIGCGQHGDSAGLCRQW